ncbi:MAG TPA: hypothetical protein VI074_09110 [Propionibacteriaceae bacterium]
MSLNTSQPFTRAEALAAGLTDVDLRSRRFHRLFHGLYVRAGLKIGVQQMAAAALHISPPGSFASHETPPHSGTPPPETSTKFMSAFQRLITIGTSWHSRASRYKRPEPTAAPRIARL